MLSNKGYVNTVFIGFIAKNISIHNDKLVRQKMSSYFNLCGEYIIISILKAVNTFGLGCLYSTITLRCLDDPELDNKKGY